MEYLKSKYKCLLLLLSLKYLKIIWIIHLIVEISVNNYVQLGTENNECKVFWAIGLWMFWKSPQGKLVSCSCKGPSCTKLNILSL